MNDDPPPVLTIDGPSGSGKGTVGMRVARQLRWHFLDSGSLYRIVALSAGRAGLEPPAGGALIDLIEGLDIRYQPADHDELRIFVDGEDLSQALRSDEVASAASRYARDPAVRRALLARQRAARRPPGLVADGRDMGTVVFPDARIKIYLTASAEVRAKRRYNQLKAKGFSDTLPRLVRSIQARDRQDQSREASPLKPAPDALVIDTSDLAAETVVGIVMERVEKAGYPVGSC